MSDELTGKDCSDIISFIESFETSYREKIPSEIYESLNKNRLLNYNPTFDKSIPIQKQMSKNALAFVGYIDYTYWSSKERQNRIDKIIAYKEHQRELESQKKYKTEDLFKNKKHENISPSSVEIVEKKKENIFIIILNKLKKLFKIKN